MCDAAGGPPREARPECVDDLVALAGAADEAADDEHKWRRLYTRGRNILWFLAAALAGVAGVLALGGASRTITAVAAFLSAFSTALEARFAPAERRHLHKEREADYRDLGRRAMWTAKHEKDASARCRDLKQLLEDMHGLEKGGSKAETA